MKRIETNWTVLRGAMPWPCPRLRRLQSEFGLAALVLSLVGTGFAWTAVAPSRAAAQLPQASAQALGMGNNMTAAARGFAAVANNPAGLGMDDSPSLSFSIPSVSVEVGIGPVTLGDLAQWGGETVPLAVKEQWLSSVNSSGGQLGNVDGGVSGLAINVGPVGLQLATRAGSDVSLHPDAVELLLYGNAGRTGEPRDFDLNGSFLNGFALSTVAVSWGFAATDRLHLGLTGSYMIGHGLVVGRDGGSQLLADPLSGEVSFPLLYPSGGGPSDGEGDLTIPSGFSGSDFDNGSGFGLDLGAIWSAPGFTVGATVQNVVNTFGWKLEQFSYMPGQAFFEAGTATSDFDERSATVAPQSLLEAVENLTPKPVYSIGVALDPSPLLRVTADVRKRTSGGLALGPEFHAGVGAELRAISFLPLRAHAAAVSGGMQLGGGAGLVLGPVNLGGAIAWRQRDRTDAALYMVTLSFGGS